MAHGIQTNDSLVLVKKNAWHGLGTILPEALTPEATLTAAGLDWTVEESTALTATFIGADGTPTRNVVESHKTLRRSDDGSILSTVGCDYCVLQNRTLAEIASSLGEVGGVRVETAGSIWGGSKVWFLLHAGTIDAGRRGDIVEQYYLLANSHDATMSATFMPTSVRVVCANTLTLATGTGSRSAFRWRHTSGLALRVEDIKAAMAGAVAARDNDARTIDALASKSLTRDEIQSLWTDVLVALDGPIPTNPKDEKQARRKAKAVEELAYMTRVFDREASQFGATAWVAANAATHLIQHDRGYLKGEDRLNADLFGSYGEAKRTVMKAALALV